MTEEPIYLCVEKAGTQFESVQNFQVTQPLDSAADRMWLDWGAMVGVLVMPTKPMQVKLSIMLAYATAHTVEVVRLPSEEFYQKFPKFDPRNQ